MNRRHRRDRHVRHARHAAAAARDAPHRHCLLAGPRVRTNTPPSCGLNCSIGMIVVHVRLAEAATTNILGDADHGRARAACPCSTRMHLPIGVLVRPELLRHRLVHDQRRAARSRDRRSVNAAAAHNARAHRRRRTPAMPACSVKSAELVHRIDAGDEQRLRPRHRRTERSARAPPSRRRASSARRSSSRSRRLNCSARSRSSIPRQLMFDPEQLRSAS